MDSFLPIDFDLRHDDATGHVFLEMGEKQGVTFVSREIPNIMELQFGHPIRFTSALNIRATSVRGMMDHITTEATSPQI